MIDLRSDTVTQPTPAMRRAIAEAPVGDDVFGDDPTVNELERLTAELLGKEAAMFVPSGTMANQLAVRLHTQPGDEVLIEAGAHVLGNEAGAAAVISGVTCRTIGGRRGIFTADDLLGMLRPPNVHHSPTRLVCVENTHNVGGGSIWPLETLRELADAVAEHGLALHMDGARLWNASAATGVAEREYAACCHTLSVCFSKGLGAPVGSALAGPAPIIERGRRFRKMLGGGMRQAGLLAAGALHALRHHRQRLSEDHANARALAEGLAGIDGIDIDIAAIETNIVRFNFRDRDAIGVVDALREQGVLMMAGGKHSIRAVTHLMISAKDIDQTIAAMKQALGAAPQEARRGALVPSSSARGE
ncbi:MAG TPA: GntG family PLP-dependent aldolase [Humisphaera sp.]|jgi:threonine aldolase|nr:GntG family PLP-dependent aldolase [Humisphaera sp.]